MASDPLLVPPHATGTTLVTTAFARGGRSLDGEWSVIVDPYDWGYVHILGGRNDRGMFRDHKPRHAGDRVEYDFDTSPRLRVPGDWNTQDPTLGYYEGTVWYRRRLEITADDPTQRPGARSFLHFGAVNHTCRVFLDGDELATHVGGFGPFSVEVTGRLTPGDHSLIVQVNNRREPTRVPAMRTDWWNFGGITRSVTLVTTPDTFLRDAWLTMRPDGSLVGGATIDGPQSRSAEAMVELVDLGLTLPVVNGAVTLDAADAASIERWSPGRPVLHHVRWTCSVSDGDDDGDDDNDGGATHDIVDDQIGFRTIEARGTDIVINGEPVFLRGISIHGEGPSGGRRAAGADDASTLLDWAEGLGANFVRLAHYQHDEHMVRECDRRGLLAWCELPVYWGIAFGDPAVLANALAQADELVMRDRSRAAVGLWSIANETLPGDDRNRFLGALAEHVRSLDDTRLVAAALLTPFSDEPTTHIEDPLGEIIDVVAINQYLGWYYGRRDRIPDIRFTTAFDKPIIFSELGAGAKQGRHGGIDEIWTEEFQADVYRAQITMIEAQTECAGLSPWILKDFRTPLRVLPQIQDGYNRKGLMSEEGEPKLAYQVLADFYERLGGSPRRL